MTSSGQDPQDTLSGPNQPREARRIPWLGWVALAAAVVGLGIPFALGVIFNRTFYDSRPSGPLEGMRLYRQAAWCREWAGGWAMAASVLALGSIALGIARARFARGKDLGCLTLCLVALALPLIPVLWRPKETSLKAVCLANLKRTAVALQMYAADHDSAFPPPANWPGVMVSYVLEEGLICPNDPDFQGSYAYNQALSRTTYDAMADPYHVVAIFESDAAQLTAGGPELLPPEPRHLGGDNYAFADGHVQWLPRKRLGVDSRGHPIWAKEPDADCVIWEPVLKKPEAGAK